MQEQESRYNQLTEVIRSFKQVPSLIEDFIRDAKPSKLADLLTISQALLEVGNRNKGEGEQQIQLFHRLYSRMREIIYAYLAYYLNSNTYFHIREFLIAANKTILQFRPGVPPAAVIKNISELIVKEVKQLGALKNVPLDPITSAFEESIGKTDDVEQGDVYETSTQSARGPPQTRYNSIIKNLGIDVIRDLDWREIQSLPHLSEEGLTKDCMYRNRFIQSQIKKYSSLHAIYSTKSPKKKNISFLHFQPTVYSVVQHSTPKAESKLDLNLSIGSKESPKRKIKDYREYSFHKKRKLLYESQYEGFGLDGIKQEAMMKIYQARQKCCLQKFIVIGSDVSFDTSPSKKPKPQISQRSSWARSRTACKSRSGGKGLSTSLSVRKN